MKTKTVSSILDVIEPKNLDVSKDLQKDEKTSASIKELFEEIRKNPGENLLSRVLTAPPEDDKLTDQELAALTVNLFFAGFETTEGLISNMVRALSDNPDQLALLRNNPELIDPAVEETLRFDSSIQKQSRIAGEDIDIHGLKIKKGDYVHFMIGAANRDPLRMPKISILDPQPAFPELLAVRKPLQLWVTNA